MFNGISINSLIEAVYNDFKQGITLDQILKKYTQSINFSDYILVTFYEDINKLGIINQKCLIAKSTYKNLIKRSGKIYLSKIFDGNLEISLNSDELEFNTNTKDIEEFYHSNGLGDVNFIECINTFIINKNEDEDDFTDSENSDLDNAIEEFDENQFSEEFDENQFSEESYNQNSDDDDNNISTDNNNNNDNDNNNNDNNNDKDDNNDKNNVITINDIQNLNDDDMYNIEIKQSINTDDTNLIYSEIDNSLTESESKLLL